MFRYGRENLFPAGWQHEKVTDEFPDPPATVPAVVRAAASGQAVQLAWQNELVA